MTLQSVPIALPSATQVNRDRLTAGGGQRCAALSSMSAAGQGSLNSCRASTVAQCPHSPPLCDCPHPLLLTQATPRRLHPWWCAVSMASGAQLSLEHATKVCTPTPAGCELRRAVHAPGSKRTRTAAHTRCPVLLHPQLSVPGLAPSRSCSQRAVEPHLCRRHPQRRHMHCHLQRQLFRVSDHRVPERRLGADSRRPVCERPGLPRQAHTDHSQQRRLARLLQGHASEPDGAPAARAFNVPWDSFKPSPACLHSLCCCRSVPQCTATCNGGYTTLEVTAKCLDGGGWSTASSAECQQRECSHAWRAVSISRRS